MIRSSGFHDASFPLLTDLHICMIICKTCGVDVSEFLESKVSSERTYLPRWKLQTSDTFALKMTETTNSCVLFGEGSWQLVDGESDDVIDKLLLFLWPASAPTVTDDSCIRSNPDWTCVWRMGTDSKMKWAELHSHSSGFKPFGVWVALPSRFQQ